MNRQYLELRVPPPVVLITAMSFVLLTKRIFVTEQAGISFWWLLYVVMGLALMGIAFKQFLAAKTTITPLDPEQTSVLVVDGVFQYTRNPMYLGMALVLAGQIIALGWWFNVIWLGLFVAYIQLFQILPEEHVMHAKFGESYREYQQQVRRWL